VSHEKTEIAAHQAALATDRAAHVQSAAAGATTATDHDRLSEKTGAIRTAHVKPEDEAEAVTPTTNASASMRLGALGAAAHQHPAALAGPTFHLAKAAEAPSSLLLARPKSPLRKRTRRMWR
jgi:hypothetical protein